MPPSRHPQRRWYEPSSWHSHYLGMGKYHVYLAWSAQTGKQEKLGSDGKSICISPSAVKVFFNHDQLPPRCIPDPTKASRPHTGCLHCSPEATRCEGIRPDPVGIQSAKILQNLNLDDSSSSLTELGKCPTTMQYWSQVWMIISVLNKSIIPYPLKTKPCNHWCHRAYPTERLIIIQLPPHPVKMKQIISQLHGWNVANLILFKRHYGPNCKALIQELIHILFNSTQSS